MGVFYELFHIIVGENAIFHATFAPISMFISIFTLILVCNQIGEWNYIETTISEYATDPTMGPIFRIMILFPFLSNIYVYKHRNIIIKAYGYKNNVNDLMTCVGILTLFISQCIFIIPVTVNIYIHYLCAASFFIESNAFLWFNAFFSRSCSLHDFKRSNSHRILYIYRVTVGSLLTIALGFQLAMIIYHLVYPNYRAESENYKLISSTFAMSQFISIILTCIGASSYVFDMRHPFIKEIRV